MSENYMDLVLCQHFDSNKLYLFRAPAFSRLKSGDAIIVETKNSDAVALVKESITISIDNTKTFKFVLEATGAKLPLKRVIGKIECKPFEYEKNEKS